MVMSMETMEKTQGTIHISERAVAAVAAVTASQIEGVAALSANLADGVASMLGRSGLGRGVDVVIDGDKAEIQIRITARYGHRIPDVALQVQEAVKEVVEAQTGYTVSAVHIVVQAVDFGGSGDKRR